MTLDPDDIFKIKYDAMVLSLRRQQPQDMLIIAQSLRHILIDSYPLLHAVNSERKLTVEFTVGMSVKERCEEMVELGMGRPNIHVLGEFPPNEPRNKLNLCNFLSFEVTKHNENYCSVKDVIKTCCNRLGAVHFGNPEKDNTKEAAIRALGLFLRDLGMKLGMEANAFTLLVIIGDVVVEGLAGLRQQID